MNTATATRTPQLIFMPGMFEETMELLTQAQEYFLLFGTQEEEKLGDESKLVFTTEMSRITLRLSSIMAWLMVKRAVHAGKISAEEANSRYHLEFQDICLTETPYTEHLLPPFMNHLLGASLELYARVHRLDSGHNGHTVQ